MIGIIGFVCRDTDIREAYNEKIEKIGGKAYYQGAALSHLGIPTRVMFYTDNDSKDIIKSMSLPNLKLHRVISKETPSIINTYKDKGLEIREWKVMPNNFSYAEEMIDDEMKKCEYIMICPLNPREIDVDMLNYLKKNTKAKLAGDLDFYINNIKENGKVIKINERYLEEILSNLDIALISKKDRIIKGYDKEILKYIGKKGPKEVIMTRGYLGALIHSREDEKTYNIFPVMPEKIVDTTGAGDTFFAAYIAARYKGKKIEDAGKFAAKVASAKLKYLGALQEKVEI